MGCSSEQPSRPSVVLIAWAELQQNMTQRMTEASWGTGDQGSARLVGDWIALSCAPSHIRPRDGGTRGAKESAPRQFWAPFPEQERPPGWSCHDWDLSQAVAPLSWSESYCITGKGQHPETWAHSPVGVFWWHSNVNNFGLLLHPEAIQPVAETNECSWLQFWYWIMHEVVLLQITKDFSKILNYGTMPPRKLPGWQSHKIKLKNKTNENQHHNYKNLGNIFLTKKPEKAKKHWNLF